MSNDVLDLDGIAADDALIESLRAGAGRADLPDDDPAVDLLLAVRDGAQAPAEDAPVQAGTPRRLVSGAVAHRRAIAVAVVAGIAATTGFGAAVAGDPAAAFKYIFDRGVDIGSRVGSPGGSSTGAAGGIVEPPHAVGMQTTPLRQGSAAAPLSDTREDTSVGFVRDSDYWIVPTPRGLEEDSANEGDSSENDGVTAADESTIGVDDGPDDSPTTRDQDPTVDTDSTDEVDGPNKDPQTDDSDPSDGPTTTIVDSPTLDDPTETLPTEPTPTETDPTESDPTESYPTETDPTESDPTPTTPTEPTTETPTESPSESTSPSSPAPTTSSPTTP